MLSNLQVQGKTPLQSFLVGQPQFRETLAREELDQLRQRVIASYHLGPLSETETRNYVEHRLRTVGWTDDPRLDSGVYAAIHRHTGGVPRKINTLCSRLLLFGFLEARHHLTEPDTDEVASDLHEELMRVLPPKGNGAAHPSPAVAEPAEPPPAAVPAAFTELTNRLAVVESYVRSHDRTIRRVLQIAAQFLEGKKA